VTADMAVSIRGTGSAPLPSGKTTDRELYVVIESGSVGQVQKVDPKLTEAAHQLAASANLLSRQI
jgi:hypothetical protein